MMHPAMQEVFDELSKIYFEASASKGFHDTDTYEDLNQAEFPSRIYDELQDTKRLFLIAGEAVEAFEELRAGHTPTETYYTASRRYERVLTDGEVAVVAKEAKLSADDRALLSAEDPEGTVGLFKPEGIPAELADIVIRVFDYCGSRDIDLAGAIIEKAAYNAEREHRHGKKF